LFGLENKKLTRLKFHPNKTRFFMAFSCLLDNKKLKAAWKVSRTNLGVLWQILVKTGHHDLVLLLQLLVQL
jgi:hypothetical protein